MADRITLPASADEPPPPRGTPNKATPTTKDEPSAHGGGGAAQESQQPPSTAEATASAPVAEAPTVTSGEGKEERQAAAAADGAETVAAEEQQQPAEEVAPFTPRSILRRRSEGAADAPSSASAADDAEKQRRASSAARRARISGDVTFMADVFYEPPPSSYGMGGGGGADGDEEVALHDRLYSGAKTKAESLQAKRDAHAAAVEAKTAKVCTFSPRTTRKRGKNGAANAQHPPYATFAEFLQTQQEWLKNVPKRLANLEKQQKDIEDGKRDPRGQMGKTTMALIAKLEKEERYEHPVADWDSRFNDYVLRKSGDAVIDELVAANASASAAFPTGASPRDALSMSATQARRRNAKMEAYVHSFSPVISAYAAAKAQREREEAAAEADRQRGLSGGANRNGASDPSFTTSLRGSLSPVRQAWERDPAGYAMRSAAEAAGDAPANRHRRASDSVFEKLYKDSAVRAAASRVLAESYVENELSTLFKPRTNEPSNAWTFSASRATTAGTSFAAAAAAGPHYGGEREGGGGGFSFSIVSQAEGFVEFSNGSYAFNGEHYAEDGSHLGPAPDLSLFGPDGTMLHGEDGEANGGGQFGSHHHLAASALLSDPSAAPRHPDVVVDSLLQKGEEYRERKQRLRQAREEGREAFPFKPKTNERSHRILKAFARRAEEELADELARRTLEELNEGSAAADPDALPAGVKGIPAPKKVAKFNMAEFTRRNERAAALRTARLQAIVEERDAEQLAECSFRPALAANSLRGFSPAGARHRHNIYAPASVGSAYSTRSAATSAAPSHRGLSTTSAIARTPNTTRNTSFAGGAASSVAASPAPSAPHMMGGGSRGEGMAGGGRTLAPAGRQNHHQQQQQPQRPQRAPADDAYEFPIAAVAPAQHHRFADPYAPVAAGGRRPSNISETDSLLHDHHDSISGLGEATRGGGVGGGGRDISSVQRDDALIGGAAAGDAEAAEQYLDDIESEMRDVLADWRSAARGVAGTV